MNKNERVPFREITRTSSSDFPSLKVNFILILFFFLLKITRKLHNILSILRNSSLLRLRKISIANTIKANFL